MQQKEILATVERQRSFFATGRTLDVGFRRSALRGLHAAVRAHEDEVFDALRADLGKSAQESYMCEVGLALDEIRFQERHVAKWARRHRCRTHLANFHATSFTIAEPLGTVLVMAPWNYPFLLTLDPLAGAIAAGNTVVVKPSAYAPASSAVLRSIVEECLDPGHVAVVEGGREENAALLDQRWDHVGFSGSPAVGRLVMSRAAEHLTPVTLELGGKSPCIVDDTCKLETAAARIAFGKYLNCGQTCVAPDYVLVDEKVKDRFLDLLFQQIAAMYGEDALANPDYGKMVNEKHYRRVLGLVDGDKVVYGGRHDDATLRIEPTVLDGVSPDDAVMGEEIFGPVLPVISYRTLDEAERFVREREKPLALYVFTASRQVEERFLRCVPFGGGCVNDTIVHLATSEMPFGGVGNSGMGGYHGRASFETFSNVKAVMKKHTWIDMPVRYQPYDDGKLRMLRKFLH